MRNELDRMLRESKLQQVKIDTRQIKKDMGELGKLLKKGKLKPKHLKQYRKLLLHEIARKRVRKVASAVKRMEKEDRENAPSSSPVVGNDTSPKKVRAEFSKVINDPKKD